MNFPSPPYSEENYNGLCDVAESFCSTYEENSKKMLTKNISTQKSVIKNLKPISKIYPNLFKNANHSNNNGNLNNKNHEECLNNFKCYVCHNNVKDSEISNHLYFGPIKCLHCGWVEEYCHNFSLFKTEQKCQHPKLRWVSDPVTFLEIWTEGDVAGYNSQEKFVEIFKLHIEKLHPIKYVLPWRSQIEKCSNFVKRKQNGSTKDTKEKSIPHEKKKRITKKKSNINDIIKYPVDGRYLLVKNAIEECPDCYRPLNKRDLVFNTKTTVIHINCSCDLLIIFALDAPEGYESPFKIVQQ